LLPNMSGAAVLWSASRFAGGLLHGSAREIWLLCVCEVPDYWEIMTLSAGYDVLREYAEGGWSQAIERVVGTFVFGLWSGVRGCMALTFTVS
jgi:hypothetical protein